MTKVYGASDDLIEFEGDFSGEVNHVSDGPCLLVLSDGTVAKIKYDDSGIWKISVLRKGEFYHSLEICEDSEAKIYSDVLHLSKAPKWAYASSDFEHVK